ncbi:MAG TPA: hypothetical protein VMH81_36730 [Bryobacteraceae bacterium]|nr:hypothetical protein [Bryobacteraceae bacterium]
MTIDERLEALAQSVEVLSGMPHANEKRVDQITRNFEITLDSIKSLERIALRHEERLDDLEKH